MCKSGDEVFSFGLFRCRIFYHLQYLNDSRVVICFICSDPEKVFAAIRGGLAGSTVMDAKVPMMLDGNFKPGFRIDLHIKDLNNALDTGHGVGTPMILTSAVQEMMQWLHNNGCGSDDHSAILKYYEKITGVEMRKIEK